MEKPPPREAVDSTERMGLREIWVAVRRGGRPRTRRDLVLFIVLGQLVAAFANVMTWLTGTPLPQTVWEYGVTNLWVLVVTLIPLLHRADR